MQITVKVNATRARSAAKVVRERLKSASPQVAETAAVEEVFPGVKSGRRAGMVTVNLPQKISHADVETVLSALQADEAVEYAEPVAPRKGRK